MTIDEFGRKIKNKYPQYNDLNDFDLGLRVLKQYPQYLDLIDQNELQGALIMIPEPSEIKISPIDVIKEMPAATAKIAKKIGRGIKQFAFNLIPATKEHFITCGNIMGEGLAYLIDPIVREEYEKGNLDILPTISRTSISDLARKTGGAILEVTLYKLLPPTAKKALLVRGGIGALRGMGIALAYGLSEGKSKDEILRDIRNSGISGAVFDIVAPYIEGLLKVKISDLPKYTGKSLELLKEEISHPLTQVDWTKISPENLTRIAEEKIIPEDLKKPVEKIEAEIEEKLIKRKPEEILPKKIDLPIPPETEGVKVRKFYQTVAESEKTTKELKMALGDINPYYIPFTNKEALAEADEIIARGFNQAKDWVLNTETPLSATKTATAMKIIKHYEAIGDLDNALFVFDNYMKQLTQAGQSIQAASLWNKLSPEMILRKADLLAQEYTGEKLSTDVRKIILEKFLEIEKMEEGPQKTKATLQVLNFIADQLPLGKGELFDIYRYQNMLSNPRSHERNIYGNLFQTFITRPIELFAEATYDFFRHPFNPAARDISFSDIPAYYKGVFTSFNKALGAFQEGMRNGYISEKILDIGDTEGIIDQIRRAKAPPILTAIPRFMEAQDHFFAVLIGEGEKARLIEQGIPEAIAQARAEIIAQKYLYRETLGMTEADRSVFSRALDELGRIALNIRRYKYIGKVWGWFVPFVRTPINIAKFNIDFSPLGLAGGSYTKEQISKAFLGSMVMVVGGLLAAQDRTTWFPPQDRTARTLFYDAGKKPLSIRIGDKWIPMWYFGPFALSLAIPAAIKYFYTETREAPTDNDLNILYNIILGTGRVITSQTPIAGMTAFFQAISGDVDYSLPGAIGFMLKQAIPFEGLVTYVNQWLDPIYRRSRTFVEGLKRDLPIVSKDLPAYERITGEEAKRIRWNQLLPWDIGIRSTEFEDMYRQRIKHIQQLEKERTARERLGIPEAPVRIIPENYFSEGGVLRTRRTRNLIPPGYFSK